MADPTEPALIKAPKYGVDKDHTVIDLDTGNPAPGVVVLIEPAVGAPTEVIDESPIAAMTRWSEFRQSSVKKAG